MGDHTPTLADVAHAAGVSTSTASLAFSGRGPVSAATKARILAAAESIGYLGPNPTARSLRRGRSGIVGIVVGDRLARSFRDPISIATLDGLVEALSPLDLGVLLLPGYQESADSGPHPAERTALDAAVLMGWMDKDADAFIALQRRGVPMVGIDGPELDGVQIVGIDNRGSTAGLGQHLIERGHAERVAVVALPFDRARRFGPADDARRGEATVRATRDRLLGLTDAGITPVTVVETPASLVEHGQSAGRLLLEVAPEDRPTAIVAQSDLLASGVLLAARELGLRVPDDVAITGFDGIDLPWLAPDVLTTVEQPLAGRGAAAGRAVAALIEGSTEVGTTLPTRLRVGTTT